MQSWRKRKQVQCTSLNVKKWCSVSALNFTLNISELLDVLAVFVHNCQNVMNEISITDNNLNQRAKDIFNVESYNVCVHSLLKCWKQHRKSIHDFESLVSERVYCVSNWQNKIEYWRHDCVLVQEQSDNIRDSLNLLNDWLTDWLWIIMFVTDSLQEDDWDKWIQYTDTLVDLFKSQNNDCSHVIHDMIELCDWSEHVFKNSWFIDDKRFYTMSMII